MSLTIDFRGNKLKWLRSHAVVTRQYYDAHEPRADEFDGRTQLENVEFLLSIIDELEQRLFGSMR